MFWPIFSIVVSLLAFAVAAWLYQWVKKLPTAAGPIGEIGSLIRAGAYTFLKTEYKLLGRFVTGAVVLIILFFPRPFWTGSIGTNLLMAATYLAGTVLSGLAGYIGISIATIANVKSASAAKQGLAPSFMAGFRGGAVMGMAVVAPACWRAAVLYLLTKEAEHGAGFQLAPVRWPVRESRRRFLRRQPIFRQT